MKCAICHNGETEKGTISVMLEKDQATLIFKHVPAQICGNCGEEYISAEVNSELLCQSEKEFDKGIMLELLEYAA